VDAAEWSIGWQPPVWDDSVDLQMRCRMGSAWISEKIVTEDPFIALTIRLILVCRVGNLDPKSLIGWLSEQCQREAQKAPVGKR